MPTADIPLVGPIINKVFGTRNERVVKRYLSRVDLINQLEPQALVLTDAQIKAKTAQFKERIKKGENASDMVPEVFAVAREAMDRNIGIRNIFNPRHRESFPKDRLSVPMRELYERLMAEMDAAEPIIPGPGNDMLGGTDPQPGWVYMDIPVELYQEIRRLFPDSKPPFRARPFDVQLLGGMVLYGGKIAEMKTGEGKTIVGPLACYMAVLDGWKVNVVTVNDYLVQRDRDWTYPFFRALGVTVGAIHPMHLQDENAKRLMYACDIVYGTTAEFGFDFLRDNMKRSVDEQVQRVREFAIVDEVDSILIDEARTPLIISGPAHEDSPRYELADQLASSRSLSRSGLRLISALCIEDHPVVDEHRLTGDQGALPVLLGTALVGDRVDDVVVEDRVVESQPDDVLEGQATARHHVLLAVDDDFEGAALRVGFFCFRVHTGCSLWFRTL